MNASPHRNFRVLAVGLAKAAANLTKFSRGGRWRNLLQPSRVGTVYFVQLGAMQMDFLKYIHELKINPSWLNQINHFEATYFTFPISFLTALPLSGIPNTHALVVYLADSLNSSFATPGGHALQAVIICILSCATAKAPTR